MKTSVRARRGKKWSENERAQEGVKRREKPKSNRGKGGLIFNMPLIGVRFDLEV